MTQAPDAPGDGVPVRGVDARAVQALGFTLRTLLVVLPVLLALTVRDSVAVENLLLGALLAATLGLWMLHRAGRTLTAFRTLVALLIAYGAASCAVYGSIRSISSLAFVGAVVLGGIFLGRSALAATVVASGAALGAVAWAEAQGLLATPGFRVGWVQWAVHVVVFAAIAVNLWFARNQVEDAVRGAQASERRFRRLFEASPAPTVIYTAEEGRIVDCNPAYEALLGRPRAAVLGRTGMELGLWHDPAQRKALQERLRNEGSVRNAELDLVAADGRVVRCLSNRSFLDVDGQSCVVAQLIDVSAEQAAREAQRTSEERFERIFRSNPAAMAITDYASGTVVDVNEAALRVLGMPRDAAIGRPTGLLHADPQAYQAHRERLGVGGALYNVPTLLRAPDGRMVDALVSSEMIEEKGRRLAINTVIDVSAEKAAREAQERSEARFERMFRESAAPTLVFTPDEGRIIDCNAAYVRLIGRPRDALIGHTGLELGIWPDPEQRLEARRLHARDGRLRDFEADLRTGDGSIRRCLLSWDEMEFGGQPGIIAYLVDITERTTAERVQREFTGILERRVAERTEQLEATLRELEAFSYSVSHDLKAPLRAIDGFTAILRDEIEPLLNDEQRQVLGRVLDNTARMNALIDDLLKLARVGRAGMAPEQVDLSATAEEIVAGLRQAAPDRDVAVSIAPGVSAVCDANLMRIALDNLIGNAWKFTGRREGARIDFAQEAMPDGRPVYVVRDNGAGFDLHYAAKLFAPFQRFHKVTEFEGTGIGLATAQRIVARHGGRIWAESAPGHGATFRFTLRANGERGAADARHSA